jgi:hypothetical protein
MLIYSLHIYNAHTSLKGKGQLAFQRPSLFEDHCNGFDTGDGSYDWFTLNLNAWHGKHLPPVFIW